MRRQTSVLLVLAAAAALSGCAVGPNPRDPMETWNRGVFKFNDTVDTYALKPVATGYKNVTPSFVQTGVNNFFGNLQDIWTGANNFLQGKGSEGASDWGRVALNSTFGILGLFDIASEAGLPKHKEDFGQTLGRWGVPAGPYIVLPFLGPSTLRDTLALPVDRRGDPVAYIDSDPARDALYGLRIVDQRSNLLRASSVLDQAALDKYSFTRDAHLQRRRAEIFEDKPVPPGATDGQLPSSDGQLPREDEPAAAGGTTPPPAQGNGRQPPAAPSR